MIARVWIYNITIKALSILQPIEFMEEKSIGLKLLPIWSDFWDYFDIWDIR